MNWILMVALLAQADASPAPATAARDHATRADRSTPVLTKVADPYDAAAWALQDALALRAQTTPQSAHHCLYVWIGPEESPNVAKINSLVVNSVLSHSSTIQIPELTAGGRLIRWDLHKLCPRPADFHRLIGIINDLSVGEPFWHVDLKALRLPAVKCDPFIWLDGKTYQATVSVPSPVTAEAYSLLQRETGLKTPLVRADYLLRKLSSTVQGGRYYHARGFIEYDQHGKPRKLNETEILAKLGVSAKLSRSVDGDDRVGIVISGVTAQARAVEFIQGAIGPVRMSYDRSSDNENIDAHPLYNLLSVIEKADGKETIFELANGLLGYIATDGKGNLADEVPAPIATDNRTPVPHPARLFAPMSCVRCHGPDGGVKMCRNDIPALLKDPSQLDIFDDFGDLKLSPEEARDKLAGLYSGDFESRTRDARNRYGDACFKATRGLTAQQAAAEWSRQYEAYWNDPVSAERQLLEIGWRGRSPQAGKKFTNPALESLLKKQESDLLVFGQKIGREDPLIVAPRLGIPIRRQDQDRTYAEQFRRAFLHRAEVGK